MVEQRLKAKDSSCSTLSWDLMPARCLVSRWAQSESFVILTFINNNYSVSITNAQQVVNMSNPRPVHLYILQTGEKTEMLKWAITIKCGQACDRRPAGFCGRNSHLLNRTAGNFCFMAGRVLHPSGVLFPIILHGR